ncbi:MULTISPECIES: PTS sugar transporter subunit IIA [Enterococcaceae]|uniref:PTS sugar transporter subunit IIA n=1 Tax=Enterococcaceae TaxID=81852 RepID=UPI000E52EB44|nr:MULTISPECIES: PTS sugar transporter subunit IIA [Enterococcaceae]MCI0131211.1 PTS sugar transporter subunit IIA [Vagococcus sp. CY53-2]RGI28944.1 PTS mannose transporter subunit IIA [Melissococcus sp. OM08-11BH]UNM89462.1 PTS sugar transporter subunit IIA [Vagococcus sp. CY52-2]
MERSYLIATHGKFASGLQNSLNILTGSGDNVQVIDAYVTDDDYTPEVQQFIQEVSEDSQGIVFTDLYGGSVNQKIAAEIMTSGKDNIMLVSNSNLAIILSIMFHENTGMLSKEEVLAAIQESQVQLVSTTIEEEDDIF